jgi:hypothetical protein
MPRRTQPKAASSSKAASSPKAPSSTARAGVAKRTSASTNGSRPRARSATITARSGRSGRKAAASGHDPMATNGSVKPDRRPVASRDSVRQVEQLAILALALIFGVIGFAVHFFWFPAIVLMAALFGLIASGLRGTRGGVFSEVVSTVVTETRSIAEATAHDADRPPSDQP